MATQSRSQQDANRNPMGDTTGGIGSPISNEAYNVITALQAKLEGLEAYRKFAKDANSELWQGLVTTEIEGVRLLADELERLVRDGKFRLRRPGQANS